MKRTSIAVLLIVALIGGGGGFIAEMLLVAGGRAPFSVALSFTLTSTAMAVLIVGFAWPIGRAVRGVGKRVEPFRAARIAILAKACSHSGALLLGVFAGAIIFMLSRTVVALNTTFWYTFAGIIGELLLIAGGLLAEHLCRIPPISDDSEMSNPEGQEQSIGGTT